LPEHPPATTSDGAQNTLYIPNLLTLLRILLVPLTIWLIVSDELRGAFAVLLVAGATDGIDGFVAKRYGWTSELGAYLDPLADKLLLVSTFVTLGIRAFLPSWLVILVVSRDVMIVSAILLSVMVGPHVPMRPLNISKFNTVAQIALALLVLANAGFSLGWDELRSTMVYITAALTAASAGAYLWNWLQSIQSDTGTGGGA
jgi:cardiolipin synthase (CMP-forming)